MTRFIKFKKIRANSVVGYKGMAIERYDITDITNIKNFCFERRNFEGNVIK